ncbi:MAG: DUF3038 domain-containing protein [Cyanobacteriota bacterium]
MAQTGDHKVLLQHNAPIDSVTVEHKHTLLDNRPDGLSTATGTIKAQLDLLLLGLESLSGESSEAVLAAAQALNLQEQIGDRVALWRLRNANPLRRGSGGRKKVDIEQARALVLVIGYLAAKQQAQIRSTLEQLELAVEQERNPFYQPLLGNYLNEFLSHYRSRMVDGDMRDENSITELALRILIELMFYSSPKGSQRLWTALLNRPEMDLPCVGDQEEENVTQPANPSSDAFPTS